MGTKAPRHCHIDWRRFANRRQPECPVHLEAKETKNGGIVFTGNGVLTLRLTERQASARLKAAAAQQGIPEDQLTGRMAYKRLVAPGGVLRQKQAAQLARAQALGLPITVSLSRKPTPKGKAQQRGIFAGATKTKDKIIIGSIISFGQPSRNWHLLTRRL